MQDIKTITVSPDCFMAVNSRREPILNTIKSILYILLGKNKLLLAIFIHRYRGKEAALRSMTDISQSKLIEYMISGTSVAIESPPD